MTKSKIYDEYVHVSKDMDETLKRCLVNHMLVYNYSLQKLYDNPEVTFKSVLKDTINHTNFKGIAPIIHIALMNELYYQYKKFKRNIRVQKLITDLHYFTFISIGYASKNLEVNADRTVVKIKDVPGELICDEPLPRIEDDTLIYFNISYSNAEDRYKVSIHIAS